MQSQQDHEDRVRGEKTFAMGCVTQNMGLFHVIGTGGGGFNGVLQPEAQAGWEIEVFPPGLARMVAVLPTGPCRDEAAGQGWAMAEVGFHPDPALHKRGRSARLPAWHCPGLAGRCTLS